MVTKSKAFEIKKMIDVEMFHVVLRQIGKKITDGRWELICQRLDTVRARYVAKEIVITKDVHKDVCGCIPQ